MHLVHYPPVSPGHFGSGIQDQLPPPLQHKYNLYTNITFILQSHIVHCDGYADIRKGKNLENDQDLVDFFSAVIRRRLQNNQ